MEIRGVDLHQRERQVSINAEEGSITDRRIATRRERFTAVFGGRPPARILLEASTESEWVTHHLESFGHEVIVADPNDAPMYANRSRRTKTEPRSTSRASAAAPRRQRFGVVSASALTQTIADADPAPWGGEVADALARWLPPRTSITFGTADPPW